MAERKSQNKYYPPDWDPSKGSVNKYVGQHPLRDRAKKISQGILVIRFEMPYNIWCGGCNSHIGMGVRYNAEKKKVGNYYSTPIWKFRMKCHLCDNYFEIQTDPKNHDYVILKGARRKEQRWDPKENEQIETEDKAVQKKMATDAMYKLEHGTDDQVKGRKSTPSIAQLEEHMTQFKDDYILNKMARNKFREEKKALKAVEAADKNLLQKSSLDIPLIKESDDDVRLAGLLKYRTTETFDEKQLQKRREIESRPIFQKNMDSVEDSDSTSSSKAEQLKKKITSSITPSKPSPFDNVTTTYRTLMLSKQKLGIRKKTKGTSECNNSMSDILKSSEHVLENEGKPVEMNRTEDSVTCETDSRQKNDNCDSHFINLSDCEKFDSDTVNDSYTKPEDMDKSSNGVNALGLVSMYSDSDTDNSGDT